jgi:broad specificity phosphatase PhoE
MKRPKRIVLIRHAESERNKALNGSLFLTDLSLFEKVGKIPDHEISITEYGKQQATKTSESLLNNIGMPDVVFHSGYRRTMETMDGVLSSYQEKPKIKESLYIREREGGYTHTLLEADKENYFPYIQDY